MSAFSQRRRALVAVVMTSGLALGLAACSDDSSNGDTDQTATEEGTEAGSSTVEIEDNHGTQIVNTPPTNVIATDNRIFETLSDWDIELVAAPVDLIEPDSPYKNDESIVNLGSHNEPDLEAVVAVEPDLILNGQRFSQYYSDFQTLAPDATIIELDPRDGEPFDEELRRQTAALGEIFGKQNEAQQLITDFDAAIERVQAAYDTDATVMGLITSGGEINYAAPSTGRTVGPVFDILGLTPALEADGSSDHQGDDISVEGIAASNPDWIIVLDRDAAVSSNSGEDYTPAIELIADSPALQNVTAVQEGQVVYLPPNTYLNEGIQTYTTFFNSLADALEGS